MPYDQLDELMQTAGEPSARDLIEFAAVTPCSPRRCASVTSARRQSAPRRCRRRVCGRCAPAACSRCVSTSTLRLSPCAPRATSNVRSRRVRRRRLRPGAPASAGCRASSVPATSAGFTCSACSSTTASPRPACCTAPDENEALANAIAQWNAYRAGGRHRQSGRDLCRRTQLRRMGAARAGQGAGQAAAVRGRQDRR